MPGVEFKSTEPVVGSTEDDLSPGDNIKAGLKTGFLRSSKIFGVGKSEDLTIATGVVKGTKSRLRIDTEASAATDDLDTITSTHFIEGDLVILSAKDSARTVVAKDGTGNLKLAGDFSMDNTEDRLVLEFDGTNFVQWTRSDNGA